MILFVQAIFLTVPMSKIWCFTGYTIFTVTRENPNFMAISEILYPLSRSPVVMPCSCSYILITCYCSCSKRSNNFTKYLLSRHLLYSHYQSREYNTVNGIGYIFRYLHTQGCTTFSASSVYIHIQSVYTKCVLTKLDRIIPLKLNNIYYGNYRNFLH